MEILLLFITFLVTNYLWVLVGVVIGNVFTGTFKALKDKSFNRQDALEGVFGVGYFAIGYLAFSVFAYSLQGIEIYDISFTSLYLIIITILIVYKGNSLVQNATALMGLPYLKVLEDLDAKVKELVATSKMKQLNAEIKDEKVVQEFKDAVESGVSDSE